MLEVAFIATGARALERAAQPAIALDLDVTSPIEIRSLMLQTQVRIDAPRRAYTSTEQGALIELFGEPSRWGRTLQGLLWANVTSTVRAFNGKTSLELHLPVSFDLGAAAAKYFEAVEGTVPLTLFFSGTVFFDGGDGLQAAPLPRSAECRFDLDAALWRDALELQFPGRAALHVDRALFDRLRKFQLAQGHATVERALEALLGADA